MRRLSRPWLIIGSAALAALLLTITRPSPEGLIGLGVGNREVRAAPGQAASELARKHNLPVVIHAREGEQHQTRIMDRTREICGQELQREQGERYV